MQHPAFVSAIAGLILLNLVPVLSAQAQIEPDRSLGSERSEVQSDISGVRIGGGARRGDTLFHSFTEFNVNMSQRVFFSNPSGVINILSRVTGSNPSRIFGTLGVTEGNANLFLINPNGIIFGPNARLNLKGSFIASTASAVNLANGYDFRASPAQPVPLLMVTTPIGLQFGTNPGAITVNGLGRTLSDRLNFGLRVEPGKTLALVGGNITLNGGFLTAPNGRVELGGLTEPGVVSLRAEAGTFRLDFPMGVDRGDVLLTANRLPSTPGALPTIIGGIGNNSAIAIHARTLNLNNQSAIESGTNSQQNGSPITIDADSIQLNRASITSSTSSRGNAGDITIVAQSLLLIEENSEISSRTDSVGNAGRIDIKAGALTAINSNLRSFTNGPGDAGTMYLHIKDATALFSSSMNSSAGITIGGNFGEAGNIEIHTGTLTLDGGAGLLAASISDKRAGDITINARDRVLLNQSYIYNPTLQGVSGNVAIDAKSITLTDSAILVATFGARDAGTVSLKATDSLVVSRVAPDLNQLQQINLFTPGVYTSTVADGNAGSLRIEAGELKVSGGARVTASTSGSGRGGALSVEASSVELRGVSPDGRSPSGLYSETLQSGTAGDITITTQNLIVKEGAQISAATADTGGGGNIFVQSKTFAANTGGQLRTTTSGSGKAGNLTLTVEDKIALAGAKSGLFADTTRDSSGQGGTITIDPQTVVIRDGAKVAVNSQGSGQGGNIRIQAENLTLDQGGQISAETASSQGGDIDLQVGKLLLLRRGSQISATAGTAQREGDGGNIRINAPFVVALPDENSNITANAFTGQGGRVDITTRGLFGIAPRTQLTPLSDITASSEFGLSGVVTINTPDVDPSRGLDQLPETPVDPSNQIRQTCRPAGTQQASSFVVTGRGGVPISPEQTIQQTPLIGWVSVDNGRREQNMSDRGKTPKIQNPKSKIQLPPIIEAQGWVKDTQGNIWLVSDVPAPSTPPDWAVVPVCR